MRSICCAAVMADYTEYHGEAIRRFVKPSTNADRIRAMTNEELAGTLCRISDCRTCWMVDKCLEGDAWLDWLQSPAEGGDGDG